MAMPTPADLTQLVCWSLTLPDDVNFIAAVAGAIDRLSDPGYWQAEPGGQTPADTAQAAIASLLTFGPCAPTMTIPLGMIVASPVVLGDGWLPCDGTIYHDYDYPDLYLALDSIFKIDPDMFFTPDLRGRTIVGSGTGTGLTARQTGDAFGAETHTLAASEIPNLTASIPSRDNNIGSTSTLLRSNNTGNLTTFTASVNTGGGHAHENMPPSLALPYYIRAVNP